MGFRKEINSNPLQGMPDDTACLFDQFLELIGEYESRIRNFNDSETIGELKNIIGNHMDELKSLALQTQKCEQDRFERFLERIYFLQRNLEAARADDLTDKLTLLANSSNFDLTLLRWVENHENSGESFTVTLIDLDNFRQINETFGRSIGDQILAFVALELGSNIREKDFLARYGGDKFGVLSSGMDLAGAEKRFSKLLQKIEAIRFQCKNNDNERATVHFTASCGIAEYVQRESANELFSRAGSALYDAKRLGRNRVATKLRFLRACGDACRDWRR
jgi:diguanylate cyclase